MTTQASLKPCLAAVAVVALGWTRASAECPPLPDATKQVREVRSEVVAYVLCSLKPDPKIHEATLNCVRREATVQRDALATKETLEGIGKAAATNECLAKTYNQQIVWAQEFLGEGAPGQMTPAPALAPAPAPAPEPRQQVQGPDHSGGRLPEVRPESGVTPPPAGQTPGKRAGQSGDTSQKSENYRLNGFAKSALIASIGLGGINMFADRQAGRGSFLSSLATYGAMIGGTVAAMKYGGRAGTIAALGVNGAIAAFSLFKARKTLKEEAEKKKAEKKDGDSDHDDDHDDGDTSDEPPPVPDTTGDPANRTA